MGMIERNQRSLDMAAVKGREPPLCDLCGALMEDVQCKLRCWNCGYTRDCSDP